MLITGAFIYILYNLLNQPPIALLFYASQEVQLIKDSNKVHSFECIPE